MLRHIVVVDKLNNDLSPLYFQVQFVIVFSHTIQIQFQSDCGFPKGIGALLSLNSGLFLYMFSAFYVKTYQKNQRLSAAKKDTLDAPPKAKPTELNNTMRHTDDFNNNDTSSATSPTSMSPLYAKLMQNGHLNSTEVVGGETRKVK